MSTLRPDLTPAKNGSGIKNRTQTQTQKDGRENKRKREGKKTTAPLSPQQLSAHARRAMFMRVPMRRHATPRGDALCAPTHRRCLDVHVQHGQRSNQRPYCPLAPRNAEESTAVEMRAQKPTSPAGE